MARVTASDVDEIMEKDLSSLDITPFITIANLLVTEKLGSSSLSADLLKEIERWLAAHFVAVSYKDERIQQEKIDVASVTYMSMGSGKTGLDMTPYGRQVKLLDTTGAFISDLVASIHMFGPTHNDITDVNA